MKNTAKTLKKLKKRISKLENKLVTNIQDSLSYSMDIVITATDFYEKIGVTDKIVEHNRVAKIDPETGEICHYLYYFRDFNDIYRIIYYLDAYLTTNKDVLDEEQIDELKRLIDYLH